MLTELAPLPTTSAATAYDLMTDIQKAILEEPARLNMGLWIAAFRRLDPLDSYHLIDSEHAAEPACGTVACYAGWGGVLTGYITSDYSVSTHVKRLLTGDPSQAGRRVVRVLGKDLERAFNQTDVVREIKSGATKGRRIKLKPGTRPYALAIVRRFEAIQAKYEGHLKRVEIPVRFRTGAAQEAQ